MITRYYWLTDERMWMFMVISGEDDVIACDTEHDFDKAALRAQKSRKNPSIRFIL